MQQKIRFQIEGMTCQACASRIEKVLNKKDFVESAGVNFASEEAQVVFDDSQTSAADIAKIIEKTGYGAKEKTEDALVQSYLPAVHGDFNFIALPGWKAANPAATKLIEKAAKSALKKIAADFSVQSNFGKIWQRNIILNLKNGKFQ